MKVKLLIDMKVAPSLSGKKGDIMNVPALLGKTWIELGHAELPDTKHSHRKEDTWKLE